MSARIRLLFFAVLAFLPAVIAPVSRIVASGSCPGPCCK
jgi:hypothetical protein